MHVPIIHVFKVKVDCLSCDPIGLHHELRSYWIFSVFWIWHPKNRSHTKQESRSNQPLHSAVHHSICYRVWRFNSLAYNDLHVDTRKMLNIVKMTVVIVPAFCHWLTWWLIDSLKVGRLKGNDKYNYRPFFVYVDLCNLLIQYAYISLFSQNWCHTFLKVNGPCTINTCYTNCTWSPEKFPHIRDIYRYIILMKVITCIILYAFSTLI